MKVLCLVLLLGTGSGFAQMVAVYADPKAPAIHRVCVLPTEAHITKLGMKGGESLAKEAEEWGGKVGAAISQALTGAGGELTGDLSPESLGNNEDARQAVLRVRQKYQSISVQMRKKPREVKKGRYTLGDEIAILPCAREADSVAFINAAGMVQTGGRKALVFLTGGLAGPFAAMSRYELSIAFLDAKSGNVKAVLWVYAVGNKAGRDPEAALNRKLVSRLKKLGLGATPSTSTL